MRFRLLLLLILIAAVVPTVLAHNAQISVLTVSQGEEPEGNVANIFLEIRPGSGLTFIDSFPLTKVDTQISTRFAREYACELANVDCSTLDFFYVIRAGGAVLQGPSAGAAMTVLTYAALEDATIRDDTVMTGTINSGGLIGPVGGVPQKIMAADAFGFKRVLVPKSDEDYSFMGETVEVIPITDVEEAIWYFTGDDVRQERAPVIPPDEYTAQMEQVMITLCQRTEQLEGVIDNASEAVYEWQQEATRAAAQSRYYTAASYCFSANLDMQRQLLRNKSQEELARYYRQLDNDIEAFDQELPESFNTIADLEVYMIVRERLIDSSDVLDQLNRSNLSSSSIAYALERYTSAVTWSSFFGKIQSVPVDISEDRLRDGCYAKLAEAEERLDYITYAADFNLEDTRRQLANAREYERQEEWALCIFTSARARSEADSVLSALYAGDINASIQRKLAKVDQILGEQIAQNNFPILAYSYYEYAQDLDDPFSSNLYTEYAMELGRLDIYFGDRPTRQLYDWGRILLLGGGILLGFVAGIFVTELFYHKKHKKHRRHKKR